MKKKIVNKFGKHYLLGKFKDGNYFYYKTPSWDCGWYWGFGYITTYTNNKNPELSRDISSHSHFSGLLGKQEVYNHEKQTWQLSEYAHKLGDNKEIMETVLTEKEDWTLCELVQTAYTLKETAETLERGGSHLTKNPCSDIIKNEAEVKRINEIVLPAIFKEIENILMPKENQ